VTVLAITEADTLLATLLFDLGVVAAFALAFGALARRFGQTPVIGEIVAGLVLGPSLLGLLPGDLDTLLFPADVRPYLQMLANVALVLFMFGIGFEVDVGRALRSSRVTVWVTGCAILLPLVAAAAVAPVLWADHPPASEGVEMWQFAAFLGVALSITAFPVLGRMLAESGMLTSSLGTMALSVAALTDLVAWTGLAALMALVGVTGKGTSVALMVLLVGAIVATLVVIRTVLLRALATTWCDRHGPAGGGLLLLVALALCAAATTRLGLHPALGAFALGVACAPRRPADDANHLEEAAHEPDSEASRRIATAAHTLASAGLVLVPLYFVVTGLKVDITKLGLDGVLEIAGLFLLVSVSKIAGGVLGATRAGFDRSSRLALGLLLNTRGLTELIVLDIGRSAGVIDGRLFTSLVIVAILTTIMTTPAMPLALRMGQRQAARAAR
jgi:Kef-type K+ transport system membrane component KefB